MLRLGLPLLGVPLRFFGSQDRPRGIPSHPKWDPRGNRVLKGELRTPDSPGYRDFPHGREMESEAVNDCPDLLNNIPGEGKHFTSKGDFSSVG